MIDLMESEDATYGRMFSILGGKECLFWSYIFFFGKIARLVVVVVVVVVFLLDTLTQV